MKTKTKVKTKPSLKDVKPRYIITTFLDKKHKKTTRIFEEIVPKQIVYEAINAWYYLSDKEYKDFPWYKDQKFKKDKYQSVTITYTDDDPYDVARH